MIEHHDFESYQIKSQAILKLFSNENDRFDIDQIKIKSPRERSEILTNSWSKNKDVDQILDLPFKFSPYKQAPNSEIEQLTDVVFDEHDNPRFLVFGGISQAGGQSQVLRGWDMLESREVAISFPTGDGAWTRQHPVHSEFDNPELIDIDTVAILQERAYPYAPDVVAKFTSDQKMERGRKNNFFTISEWIPHSYESYMQKLPLSQKLEKLKQIANILDTLYDFDPNENVSIWRFLIHHMDVSLNNIRFDNTGNPRIIDFGVAMTPYSKTYTPHFKDSAGSPERYLGLLEGDGIDPTKFATTSQVYEMATLVYKTFTWNIDSPDKYPGITKSFIYHELEGHKLNEIVTSSETSVNSPSALTDKNFKVFENVLRNILKKQNSLLRKQSLDARLVELKKVMKKAFNFNPKNRYSTVTEFIEELEKSLISPEEAGDNLIPPPQQSKKSWRDIFRRRNI